MRIKFLVFFLCFLFLFGSLVVVVDVSAQSYLFNFEKWGGYFRIPSFSLTNAVVTSLNSSGGFQFNITLSRYRSQFVSIRVPVSSFGFEWLYQGALSEELDVLEYDFVNATHAIKGGVVVLYRPENVVGSYAVYSNFSGGVYGTGKVFHLYRPLLIDAVGSWSWADLNVSGGFLTIGCSQVWLQGAVYPVVVDPTFGYTSVGGSDEGVTGNAMSYKAVLSEDGDLSEISAYIESFTGSDINVVAGIYDDSGGAPNNLLYSSSAVVVHVGYSWVNFTVSGSLSSGTYWLALLMSNTLHLKWDSGTGWNSYKGATYPNFPDPFNRDGTQDRKGSIFGTYSVGQSLSFDLSESFVLSSSVGRMVRIFRSGTETMIFEGAVGVVRDISALFVVATETFVLSGLLGVVFDVYVVPVVGSGLSGDDAFVLSVLLSMAFVFLMSVMVYVRVKR